MKEFSWSPAKDSGNHRTSEYRPHGIHSFHFTEEETEACEVMVLCHWQARPWKSIRGHGMLSSLRNSVGKLGLHVATFVGTEELSVLRSKLVSTYSS